MISVTGLCSFSFGALWQYLHMYTRLQQTQQKSNAIIIISEGCWLFVMRGNMTCPQTMGCCFLHEANAAFDRQLPFLRFAKVFDFHEVHFTHTPPLYPDKEISSLMFSRNCLFSFTSPSVPQNKWWHADLTFWIFCGMVGWHNTAEEFGDFHKSKQTSGPSLNN